MKSRMAGVLNLWFSIFKGFLLSAPFFRGLRRLDFRKIGEKSFTKLWALDCWFSRTNDQRLFALKKGAGIGGMIRNACEFALADDATLTYGDETRLRSIQEQIEILLPRNQEQEQEQEQRSEMEQTM